MSSNPSQIISNIPIQVINDRQLPEGEENKSGYYLASIIEVFFTKHRKKLVWVHALMFCFFVVMLVVPLYLPEPAEDATPLSDFTSFSNYIMWGLWFPLVFLSVVFTGRSWCGLLCPMGAASEWANKIGLQKEIPAWIRWEGTPIVSFLLVTIWGQTIGVRDHAESLAIVFGSTLLAAIILGYVYGRNKRVWCRHICPIGLLLGVFSRIGAVEFVPKRKKKKSPGRWTEKTACPTMIDLGSKDESRHCIECFRCVNPKAKGGLFFKLRMPGIEVEEISKNNPNMAEIWFFFLGIGIALGGFLWLVLPEFQSLRQMFGNWLVDNEYFYMLNSGPGWLMVNFPERREVFNWMDFTLIVSFMMGFMLLLSSVLTITTAASSWLAGYFADKNLSFRGRFIELGYQYAPIAMISLIIGLGAKLFELLTFIGMTTNQIAYLKVTLFTLSLIWSLRLSYKILANQGINRSIRWIPMMPGVIGSSIVGLAWWPALGFTIN